MNLERRKQIGELRKQKLTTPEICKILGISKGTVGWYLKSLYNDPESGVESKQRFLSLFEKSTEEIQIIKNNIKNSKRNLSDIKILNEDYNKLSFERLGRRIKIEQNFKCNKCGISEWLGEKITLELEHIDGNNKNNKRENLEAICPNCHSLTSTWRGRNKKQNRDKITDSILIDVLVKHKFNIRQSLLELGLAAKGGNYKRCYRLIKDIENNIPISLVVERENDIQINIQKRIELVKNSNIDFSKIGWGKKLAQLLGLSNSGAKNWVKKHIPNLI